MIIDSIKNASLYYALGDRIAAALKYIEGADLPSLPKGRHEIQGDEVYALVQDYLTKPKDAALWEAHRKYIDIQFVVSGTERMGYTSLETMTAVHPAPEYNEVKDVVKFDGEGSFFIAEPGTFAIFAPQDAHMPGINVSGSEPVRKVVVKVLANGL